MVAWIGTLPEQSGLRIASYYAVCNTNNPDYTVPSGEIDAESLAVPAPLQAIVDTWADVFTYGLSNFVAFDSLGEVSMAPMDSWYYSLNPYSNEDVSNAIYTLTGYAAQAIILNEKTQELLTTYYSSFETTPPVDWTDLDRAFQNIQLGLGAWANDSVISGNPVDATVVTVRDICVDPQSYYATPEEALSWVKLGADGLASSQGLVMPPVP